MTGTSCVENKVIETETETLLRVAHAYNARIPFVSELGIRNEELGVRDRQKGVINNSHKCGVARTHL